LGSFVLYLRLQDKLNPYNPYYNPAFLIFLLESIHKKAPHYISEGHQYNKCVKYVLVNGT